MKKRSLAVFLAVCVTLGSVLLPAGTETYADQISVGETEIEDTEMAEPTGESEADGNGETSTETEQAEKEEGTGNRRYRAYGNNRNRRDGNHRRSGRDRNGGACRGGRQFSGRGSGFQSDRRVSSEYEQ